MQSHQKIQFNLIKPQQYSNGTVIYFQSSLVSEYGGYGEMAQKVIEGDMSHVKSYA